MRLGFGFGVTAPIYSLTPAIVTPLLGPTFRDDFNANPGVISTRAGWLGTYNVGQASTLAQVNVGSGVFRSNGSASAAYGVVNAGVTDAWIDICKIAVGGRINQHLTAQPDPVAGIAISTSQSVVTTNTGIVNVQKRVNGGTYVVLSQVNGQLSGLRIEFGDVISTRYNTVGGVTSLRLLVNGKVQSPDLPVSGEGFALTNMHGMAGDAPTTGGMDEMQIGNPATQALISLYQPNRVIQINADGSGTWELSGEYTQAAPSSLRYTLYDVTSGFGSATPVAGQTDVAVSGLAASGGLWSGRFIVPAAQLTGTLYYVIVRRPGLVDAQGQATSSFARGPVQRLGDTIGWYGQSLGVFNSRQNVNAYWLSAAQPDSFWYGGEYSASSPEDYQRRSYPMTANTDPNYFAMTLRGITGRGVTYVNGGFSNTNTDQRAPGSVYYNALMDTFRAAGMHRGFVFIVDGQSNRSYPVSNDLPGNAATYKAGTLTYMNAMRAVYPALKFIMVPIAGGWGEDLTGESFQNIRQAQWELCQENPAFIFWGPHMMDLQHKDELHIVDPETAAGMLGTGEHNRRCALAYAKLKGYAVTDRNGPTMASFSKVSSSRVRVVYDLNGFDSLQMLNESYNNEHHGGHTFAAAATFATPIWPTSAIVDASPAGGQQGVEYLFSGTPFTGSAFVRAMFGAVPTNPTGNTAIRADVLNKANVLVGVKGSEPKVSLQPFFAKVGQTTVSHLVAA